MDTPSLPHPRIRGLREYILHPEPVEDRIRGAMERMREYVNVNIKVKVKVNFVIPPGEIPVVITCLSTENPRIKHTKL